MESSKVLIKMPTTSPPPFDHGASKYKCFYGYFHVKPGVIFVAIIMLLLIYSPIWNCIDLISERPITGSFLLLSWIAWIPFILCLFVAVSRKNRYFLLPFIIYAFISAIVTFIIAIVYLVVVLLGGGSEEAQEVMKESKLKKVMFNFIYQSIWFAYFGLTNIVADCFFYFWDLDNYTGTKHIGYIP